MTGFDLERVGWPEQRLGEAFEELVRRSRVVRAEFVSARPLTSPGREEVLNQWFSRAAATLGVEVEPLSLSYAEAGEAIAGAGPAIVRVPGTKSPQYLVLVSASARGRIRLLDPELDVLSVRAETVRSVLCAPVEEPMSVSVDRLIDEVEITGRRRFRARRALLEHALGETNVASYWMVRASAGAPFFSQLLQTSLVVRAAMVLAAHLAQFGLFLCAWWLIGRGALNGHLDAGWLWAWALLLLTVVPLRLASVWQQGRFVIGTGSLLKRRLLRGLLQLDPASLRHQGVGQLLGRVIEADAVEALLLSGGSLAILSALEIVITMVVLGLGAGGAVHALLFASCVLATVGLWGMVLRARERWTKRRLELTHGLVECMVGHRTRLVQLARERTHEGEDELLNACLEAERASDRLGPAIAMAPSLWRFIGIAGLAAPFVSGNASTASVAVAVGGIILGSQALTRLCSGLDGMIGARIGWKNVAPVFHAGALTGSSTESIQAPGTVDAGQPLLTARDLVFCHSGRHLAVLSGVNLRIAAGERVLVTGESGGGKSTLASLLAGIRRQQAGLLLLLGRDVQTLGERQWRSHIGLAPQFHENHVITETLAFNLLMGRGWPPTACDLKEAEEVCRELGLGDLLERMPSGLMQMVGDTAWQLSHGERSRVFMARSLLQGADLVVLDETFAALDAATLRMAVECARHRARSLMVIAHP